MPYFGISRLDTVSLAAVKVAVGLVISGVSTYAFLIVAARVLTVEQYANFGVAWAMIFIAATGLFLPIEQEVIRAISARRSEGADWSVVLRRAWLLAIGFALLATLATFALWPLLYNELLKGDGLLLAGFSVSLFGYAVGYLVRGVLAGTENASWYSFYVGWDGVLRAVLGVGLILFGWRTAGAFGLIVGISALLAPLTIVAGKVRSFRPRSRAENEPTWNTLTASLGALLVGSLASQILVNAGPLALQLLVEDDESDLVSSLFAALIMARVPLFMFQSVQAALLPRLSGQAQARSYSEMNKSINQVVGLLLASTAVLAIAGSAIGPLAIRILFGDEFRLGSIDVALLVAMVGLHLITITYSQALVALLSQVRMAASWVAGLVVAVAVLFTGFSPLLRVELALVSGEATAAMSALALLRLSISRAHQLNGPTTESQHQAGSTSDH